ncbi:hypothetical protein J3R30DRAFT_3656940 [Lentinula aciculospora]|uniref:Myb-like domain-containing protein n=1 Tax=Lentinula aciculospora TaxID=153920 RepID=A0A9W9DPM6_9AGAR|nr:hypothetical protein J3R30DRAFT_3656940 [Lentinula aciculospora]
MDNPQYYQPLSHALNPPRSSSQPQFYKTPSMGQQKAVESDDDDEGMVEDQLSRTSAPPSPKPGALSEHQHEPEPKRRGRPRGSKNRRGRVSSQTIKASPPSHQPLHATGQGTNPPQLPEVTAQNQQYYEFQWRVLNLCAEFYGAAEELVKGTPALVIAQCYQMGPSSKVDPLNMLSEAKQNCDTLLANPSRLITAPPPPMYPIAPTFYTTNAPPPGPIPTSGVPAAAPAMISQPQTFVVPMGSHAYYGPPPPSQYPTASYYSYPYGHPGVYYAPPVAAPAPSPTTHVAPIPPTSMSTLATGNSGAWSDDEIERLKSLTEERKTSSGEIDWDDIISQWGSTRTRHQILIKATQLGLKESSSVRGVKRRRDIESNGDPNSSAAPTPTATVARNPSSTPSSTPVASPSIQNQQQPSNPKAPSSISATSTTPAGQPWPMPVVAVNTLPPVVGPSASEHRATSYYRPRPTDPSSRPSSSSGSSQLPTVHRYMYQPNGHHLENEK